MTHMRMTPADADHAMNRLDAAGADLTAGWSSATAAINAAIAQLGKGVLGQAFLQGYQPHADEVAAAAAKSTQTPGHLAGTGHQSIRQYTTVDSDNAGLFGQAAAD